MPRPNTDALKEHAAEHMQGMGRFLAENGVELDRSDFTVKEVMLLAGRCGLLLAKHKDNTALSLRISVVMHALLILADDLPE